MEVNGGGTFDGLDFEVKRAKLVLNGSGNVELFVGDYLEVEINGSGNLKLKGNPAEVITQLNGTGRIIKL